MKKNIRKIFSPGNYRLQCLLLTALFVTIPVSAAAQATLEWELVNPFRFIHNRDATDELRRIYGKLVGNRTAENFERALQDAHETEVLQNRARLAECGKNASETEARECVRRYKNIHYSGWFSKLAENDYAGTCWDGKNARLRNDGACENYIHPKSHLVQVWIENFDVPAGARIDWYKNENEKIPGVGECYGDHKNCVTLLIDYSSSATTVSAKIADVEIARRDNIKVEDELVVALGDSYASGEGNPDRPAYFDDNETDIDVIYKRLRKKKDFFMRREPKRDKNPKVAWLDPRCHRSMYSYSFKAALLLALSKPQRAVTYVSYACSGAETTNIIDKPQQGSEPLSGAGKKVPAQLKVLKEALECKGGWRADKCKKNLREIDYLLLSTGGNEVGFAKFVAYVILGFSLPKTSKKPTDKTPDDIKDKLKISYENLHKMLTGDNGLNIKDCEEKNCKRVFLTAYPNILHDEDGKLCEGNRGEFDIPFGPSTKRPGRIADVGKLVMETLTDFYTKFEKTSPWTIITSHIDRFKKRGFCARGDQNDIGEKFLMPTRINKIWDSFEPSKYKAYQTRRRWVRLPVDSKLTTDQVIKLGKLDLRILFIDVRSNIMHPTAEGFAVMADECLTKMQAF